MADHAASPFPAPTSPLVGRERERVVLREALAAALAGRGALVLVGGEAGIGKTALAETLLTEATEAGALALVGRCYDLSETPPYGPWAEAIARAPYGDGLPMPPDLAGGVDVTSQAALFAQAREYLASLAAARPLMLLLDDLHWADPASLDLLRVVGRQLAVLPLLIVATYRADELTHRRPLHAALPLLVREARATRLDLRPLREGAIRALVAAHYVLGGEDTERLVGYLAARTEGNALFLGEVLRALEEAGALRPDGGRWALGDPAGVPVPALLRQVIEGRAARLGEAARRLLAVAAVLGQAVPLDLWATVAGVDEERLVEAVERAVEARLLDVPPAGDAVRFAHALVREALYEGTLPLHRRRVHQRAAEALVASPAPDPDAVAYHFQQAGDRRAAVWLARAAERAQRVYAYRTACARFEAALASLPADTARRERGWLGYRLAVLRAYDDRRRGIAELEVARRDAELAGDPYLAAYARYYAGMNRADQGEAGRGIAEMAAAVAALEALPPVAAIRLDALDGFLAAPTFYEEYHPPGALVLQLALLGRYAEARDRGARNVAEAGDAASGTRRAALGDAYLGLGVALAELGDPVAARGYFARARNAYAAIEHWSQIGHAARTELHFVALPYAADRLAEREHLAAQAEEAWGRADQLDPEPPAINRLLLSLIDGRWGEARRLEPIARASHWSFAIAIGYLARDQGDPEAAWAAIRARLPDGPATPPGERPALLITLAQRLAVALALDAGDLPAARAWLDAHGRWLAWSGAVRGRAEDALCWAAYHRAAGDIAAAGREARRALAYAASPRQPLALLAAHRTLGELGTAAERHAEAAGHLEAALTLAEACAAPFERALAFLALAELRAAEGRDEDAVAPLAAARAIFAEVGAAPALARAAALADRLATAASAAPAALPFGLSPREAEVLRLVAEGLSDAQVAERLFLSPYTVKAHLRAVYNKLDVPSRTAAAHRAREHGLA